MKFMTGLFDEGDLDLIDYEIDEGDIKLSLLKKYRANLFVNSYFEHTIKNVFVKICDDDRKRVIDMIKGKELLGWCWQSTSFLVPLFDNNACIVRGNLYFYGRIGGNYFHSWIEFTLNDKRYVFAPCFDILCLKEFYDSIFDVDIYSKVPSVKVKEILLDYLLSSEEKYIYGDDNVYAPFYRTNSSVYGKVKNKKIMSLYPHYFSQND